MADFIFCFGSDDEKKTNKTKKAHTTYKPESERHPNPKKKKKNKKEEEVKTVNAEVNAVDKEDKKKTITLTDTEKIENMANSTTPTNTDSKSMSISVDTNITLTSTSPIRIDPITEEILSLRVFPEELEYGNKEYKLKIVNKTRERIQGLITQMEFRLREGHGECFYLIGVEDSGNPLGLSDEELRGSLENLKLMSEQIGATMSILYYFQGYEGLIAEVMVTKPDIMRESANKTEIRIGLIGEEGSGKSTLIGCLITNKKDNGKGLTRSNVFRHKHEVICGKTSSISHQIVGFDEKGRVTNHNSHNISWAEIVDKSVKIINFFDMGGSEKALKTTVKTLSKNYLDYVFLVIPANTGITSTTSHFLKIAVSMDLPIVVIFTKIDLISEEDLGDVLFNFKCVVKSEKIGKNLLKVENSDDIVTFSRNINEGILPVFLISNKASQGLNLFQNFLNVLPMVQQDTKSNNDSTQFDILETYMSESTLIILGIVTRGMLLRGKDYLLGPDANGDFKTVNLTSIHCKKIDVKTVSQGQFCSIVLDGSVTKDAVRSGMVLLNTKTDPTATRAFEAEVWSIDGSERKIRFTTQPMIHIAPVRQSVKIYGGVAADTDDDNTENEKKKNKLINTEEEFTILPNKSTKLFFEFMYNPEFVREGADLIIYENNFKIYGYITRIIN